MLEVVCFKSKNCFAHSLACRGKDQFQIRREIDDYEEARCFVLVRLDCLDRDFAPAALILDRAKVDARRSEGIPVRILFNRAHRRGQIAASPRNAIIIFTPVIPRAFTSGVRGATASGSAAHSENAVNYR